MSKKQMVVRGVLLAITFAMSVLAVSMAGCGPKQHDPYSQNYSALEKVSDFSLGGDVCYFDKLQTGEENILLFWSSWCPHCESLIEKVDQMDGKDVIKKNLFTVAEDKDLDDIEGHKDDFPIYLDQDESVFESLGLEHIPSVFIVNDQGEVLGSAQGEEDSLALLQEYAAYNK